MENELFTPEFYKELIQGQAETNAQLGLVAERLSNVANSLAHIEPILSKHEARIARIERYTRAIKKTAKLCGAIIVPALSACFSYRKQIVDTLKHLFHTQ